MTNGGYISYGKIRSTFVFHQFHIEGFVDQYKLESLIADKNSIVVVSEAFEHMPQGRRARETYTINNDSLTEIKSRRTK